MGLVVSLYTADEVTELTTQQATCLTSASSHTGEVCNRQTTTGAERRRTSRQRTTVDCHRFYMPTCTGSMCQIGSGTSLVLQSTDVSTTKRHSIWSTAAFQSQTSPVVSDYVPHVVVCWRYHAIDVAHSAVGHSQSPDPLSGTCF